MITPIELVRSADMIHICSQGITFVNHFHGTATEVVDGFQEILAAITVMSRQKKINLIRSGQDLVYERAFN